MAKKCGTIKLVPKWEGLMPLLINWLESGTKSQKKCAKEELTRVAKGMDKLLEHDQCGGLTCRCGEQFDLR